MIVMERDEEVRPQNNKKKISEKILSVSTSVLLILALIFCFSVVYQIQRYRYVSVFGCSVFRVVSDSMEPEIPVGALLLSKKTDIEKIKLGDVICFRSMESYMYGQIVTHRVVGIEQTKNGEIALRTRGDSNNSEDGFYVTSHNLVGKVIDHTGEGSFIMNAYSVLTSGFGFFTLIVIPVVVITVIILHENIKKIKEEMKAIKLELARENLSGENTESDDSVQDDAHEGEKTDDV